MTEVATIQERIEKALAEVYIRAEHVARAVFAQIHDKTNQPGTTEIGWDLVTELALQMGTEGDPFNIADWAQEQLSGASSPRTTALGASVRATLEALRDQGAVVLGLVAERNDLEEEEHRG